MSFSEVKIGDVTMLKSSLIPMKHGFTTRLGGVSPAPIDSMNLGENRGDPRECVRENYKRVAEAIDFKLEKLVYTRQVHENEVRIASSADSRDLFTATDYSCDGLVTGERDLPIVCFVADCVPVLLCDAKLGIAGAIHCGWRSSVADILAVAIEKMCSLGSKPCDITAAIGVGIGACCFEVGEDVVLEMKSWLGGDATEFIKPKTNVEGKYLVDLRGANRRRLISLGLLAENIDLAEDCTMCSPDKYWSHRHTKGVRGNMAAIIVP